MTAFRSIAFIVLLIVSGSAASQSGNTTPNNVCNCKGYSGPGGPCYDGPGGAAYDGPGGPAYSGPGGACYAGPGGPEYDGPGGDAYDGAFGLQDGGQGVFGTVDGSPEVDVHEGFQDIDICIFE